MYWATCDVTGVKLLKLFPDLTDHMLVGIIQLSLGPANSMTARAR